MKTIRKTAQKGAALAEYGLLVGLVAVTSIAVVSGLGQRVAASFENATVVLADAATGEAARPVFPVPESPNCNGIDHSDVIAATLPGGEACGLFHNVAGVTIADDADAGAQIFASGSIGEVGANPNDRVGREMIFSLMARSGGLTYLQAGGTTASDFRSRATVIVANANDTLYFEDIEASEAVFTYLPNPPGNQEHSILVTAGSPANTGPLDLMMFYAAHHAATGGVQAPGYGVPNIVFSDTEVTPRQVIDRLVDTDGNAVSLPYDPNPALTPEQPRAHSFF